MLSVKNQVITFASPAPEQVGTVRYTPSFRVEVERIRVVGYALRNIIDDESGFLVLVDNSAKMYSFNIDIVSSAVLRELEAIFGFILSTDTPDYSYEDGTRGLSIIMVPPSLKGKPLFKGWSWFTPRGFLKNIGYAFATDNLIWERVTDEVRAYIQQQNTASVA